MRTFVENFKLAWHHYSTYAVLGMNGAAAWWLSLPLTEQAAWLIDFPYLKYLAPVASIATFFFLKSVPQKPPQDST